MPATCPRLLCQLKTDRCEHLSITNGLEPQPDSLAALIRDNPGEVYRQWQAHKAKQSLAEFVRQAWHETDPTTTLEWSWHHDALCLHLEKMFFEWMGVSRGKLKQLTIQNLVINVPPGTNKSRIVSVFFPAWAWLHQPAWSVICLSANPQVASRDAPICRNLIESPWYQETFEPGWRISDDTNAKAHYRNTAGGERRSFGIESVVTGLRADALLLDDPNSAATVNSEVTRHSVNVDAWDITVGNRLNNLKHGLRIVIQQRLHDDDLTGHLLRQGGWEHVRIPLLYETKSDCGCPTCLRGETLFGWRDKRTVDGEVLHPARFPQHVIDSEMARLGSYGFAGQMQQRPAPEGGGIFKKAWFGSYETLPQLDDVLIAADCANKITTMGSYNVLMVVGKKGPWRYILDVQRNRGEWTALDIAKKLEQMQEEWSAKTKRTVKILVEDKAMGPTVIQMLTTELKLQGVIQDDEAQKARDDKVSRAMAVQPQVEGRNVMLPEGAPWLGPLMHELCTFPASANNDQVDTFTMALNYWRGSSGAERARMMAKR